MSSPKFAKINAASKTAVKVPQNVFNFLDNCI